MGCILIVESWYSVDVDDEVLTVKSPGSSSPTSTSVLLNINVNPRSVHRLF